jgi:hypothetical protein
MTRPTLHAITAALVLLCGAPAGAAAQRSFFGAGVGVASLPRSLTPLCGSARRLTGPTLNVLAGFHANRLRVSTGLDATARGYSDAAGCVPRVGTSVDSIFAQGTNSAVTAAGDVWLVVTRQLNLGVGAGWVPGHESWFLSGGLGSQYRKLRLELAARWHRASFEEVTRDFSVPGVREISRSSHTEGSWGGVVRLLLVSR